MDMKSFLIFSLILACGCAAPPESDDDGMSSPASCEQSTDCEEQGDCAEALPNCFDRCMPANDYHCQQSLACAQSGACCMVTWTINDGMQGCTGCASCD